MLCAGSSVIPGCGVFTTLGGIAGYGENRRLFGPWPVGEMVVVVVVVGVVVVVVVTVVHVGQF